MKPPDRQCGDCQLCCKLLPTKEISKPANTRCKHQRHGKGCAIYAKRPFSCMVWNCRWLNNDDTADLSRPDRTHYVIDVIPDYITMQYDDGQSFDIPVLQIWVDPNFPDAHRDPHLRAYLARRGEKERMAAMIRYNSSEGFVLFPPALTGEGFVERTSAMRTAEHSLVDTLSRFGGKVTLEER
jgi:hypothetical protein